MKTAKKVALKPVGNRVIAQRIEEEESLGSIIVPDSAKKKQEKVKIVAVGEGKKLENGTTLPLPVQEGDVVLMDQYSGQEITIDGEEYIIVKVDDIVAIVE